MDIQSTVNSYSNNISSLIFMHCIQCASEVSTGLIQQVIFHILTAACVVAACLRFRCEYTATAVRNYRQEENKYLSMHQSQDSAHCCLYRNGTYRIKQYIPGCTTLCASAHHTSWLFHYLAGSSTGFRRTPVCAHRTQPKRKSRFAKDALL